VFDRYIGDSDRRSTRSSHRSTLHQHRGKMSVQSNAHPIKECAVIEARKQK
jgi:hypothetical protein